MRGAGYFWKTESERESAKRKMTARDRKKYLEKRSKNAQARYQRWENIKRAAAVSNLARNAYGFAKFGYGTYKNFKPK
jgi:hypothetical protein